MGEKYMSYFVNNEYHMIDQTIEENRSYTITFKNCIARTTLHHQEFAILRDSDTSDGSAHLRFISYEQRCFVDL